MNIESCRDCENFEDRRDMERVAVCAMHHGPSVCCPEFTPCAKKTDARRLYNRFCLNCVNFENVDGIPVCARDHRPGVACGAFKSRESTGRRKRPNQIPMITMV